MLSAWSLIATILLIGAFGILGLMIRRLNNQIARLTSRIDREFLLTMLDEKTAEIGNTVALTALGLKFPVFLGDASIDSFHARYLVQQLVAEPPGVILELGSGSSTVLIARAMELQKAEDYLHISIDHESHFLEISRKYAQVNGVEDRVKFAHCPLVKIEPLGVEWYADVPQLLEGKKIDLLIVDGPPACQVGQEKARLPALQVLYPHLAEKCTIILDDANRPGEIEVSKEWLQAYPEFHLTRLKRGKGIAVLTR